MEKEMKMKGALERGIRIWDKDAGKYYVKSIISCSAESIYD
jgi:hypothetical protein